MYCILSYVENLGIQSSLPFCLACTAELPASLLTSRLLTSNSMICAQWGRKIKVSPFSGVGMGER